MRRRRLGVVQQAPRVEKGSDGLRQVLGQGQRAVQVGLRIGRPGGVGRRHTWQQGSDGVRRRGQVAQDLLQLVVVHGRGLGGAVGEAAALVRGHVWLGPVPQRVHQRTLDVPANRGRGRGGPNRQLLQLSPEKARKLWAVCEKLLAAQKVRGGGKREEVAISYPSTLSPLLLSSLHLSALLPPFLAIPRYRCRHPASPSAP